MAKLKVNLNEAFCEKKKCRGPRSHRHHKGHEFLFIPRWQDTSDKKKREWVECYWQFRDEDIVRICPRHHAEIHMIYDRLIIADSRKLGKRLDDYTYTQALKLRKKLTKACDVWMKQETKGADPKQIFGRVRTKNQLRPKHGGEKKGNRDS